MGRRYMNVSVFFHVNNRQEKESWNDRCDSIYLFLPYGQPFLVVDEAKASRKH